MLVLLIVDKSARDNVVKVYCSQCDIVFDSQEKFDRHLPNHSSSISCETCPIDIAIDKLRSLFKRSIKSE